MADTINYDALIKSYPWAVLKGQKYILSPDSDGFLCGLAVTNYLAGEIVGYYDGKILLIRQGINAEDCIFLDHDINRQNIRSIGHHMIRYNKNLKDVPNFNYDNSIQANELRGFDGRNDFQCKYPFGTIHLLLGTYQAAGLIQHLQPKAVWPLLFTDGVWNNLFGYTENCLDWIEYLGINKEEHILNKPFCKNDMSFYEIMLGLNDFLRMRDQHNAKGYCPDNGEYIAGGRNKRTGDKLKITDSRGNPINIIGQNQKKIHDLERGRIVEFIVKMSEYLEWNYIQDRWCWGDFVLHTYQKDDFSDLGKTLNNSSYLALMAKNPLSLAMTSGMNIEYTLEMQDKL